jgi:hypothetical protein
MENNILQRNIKSNTNTKGVALKNVQGIGTTNGKIGYIFVYNARKTKFWTRN